MGHDHGMHEGWGGMWVAAPLLCGLLLLLALLAVGLWWLWRRGSLRLPDSSRHASAEERARIILAERFARGDIDAEEFMERSSLLNWTPGVPQSDRPPLRRR